MPEQYDRFDIRRFIAEYGRLDECQIVPDSLCAKYRDRLPSDLVAFWQDNGIGTWLGGKFQFCIPATFTEVIGLLLTGDPEIDPTKTHVIGYSAFGELLIWNEEFQTCQINLRYSTLNVGRWNYSKLGVTEWRLAAVISGLNLPRYHHIDADQPGYASLFDEAVDLIGRLKLGQCYGFFPALALGGAEKIKHVQIVDARVHFTLLAELGPLRIRQMTEHGRIEFIRYAGRQ